MQTLWITAAASAAAAYVTSQIWAAGTLAAAAFTPVLVAILKEGLAKSTRAVTQAVPVRGVVRSARPQGPEPYDPAAAGDPTAAQLAPSDEDLAGRVAQPGEITYHGTPRGSRGLRVAIVTGLLGFLIAAVVFTVPELVAGGSAAGDGRGTTIFGGGDSKRRAPAVTETTTTESTTVTTPPERTVTLPPPPPTATQSVAPPDTTPPPDGEAAPEVPPAVPGEPVVPEDPTAQPPG